MSSALTKRLVLTSEPKDRPYELRDAQVRGLTIPEGYKGREGSFEFIKDANGVINHRLFKPEKEL